MNRKTHILLYVLILFVQNSFAQEIKKMDRKKWKELVEEVRKKRYDPREKPYQSSQSETEYYSTEEANYNNYSGDGENYSSGEEGIYDAGSNDDEIFFSEENDKARDGKGNNPWNEDDLDSRYNDGDGDGSGNGNGNGNNNEDGEYDSYADRKNEGDVYYEKDFKKYDKPDLQRTSIPKSNTEKSDVSTGTGNFLLIVLIVILSAALIYMILVSFGNRNKKVKPVESVENKFENLTITKSELELALEAALKNQNYREAVRIYFIAVIKEMKDRNWIKWEKKKTNYNYINEINGRKQQPDFITATRAFEIVWYGNRSLAENEYVTIEPLFKKLLSSINS